MSAKKILILIALIGFVIACTVITTFAVSAFTLKKAYLNVNIDDFYSFGSSSDYYLTDCTASTLSVNIPKYDYDVIVTGATLTESPGAITLLVSSLDTKVYQVDKSIVSLALTYVQASANIAIVKHDENNLFVSAKEDLDGLTQWDAVAKNLTFFNDGTMEGEPQTNNHTDSDDHVTVKETISYNVKNVYLINDLTLTSSLSLKLPANINRLWFDFGGDVEYHNTYFGKLFIDGIGENAAVLSIKNYGGCSFNVATVTVADFETVTRADALSYAQYCLPQASYSAVILPKKYLAYALSYTDNLTSTPFDGKNPYADTDANKVTVSVTVAVSGGGNAIKAIDLYARPLDYVGYVFSKYSEDVSTPITLIKHSGLDVTVTLDSTRAVYFEGTQGQKLSSIRITNGALVTALNTPYSLKSEIPLCYDSSIFYKLTLNSGAVDEVADLTFARTMRISDNPGQTLVYKLQNYLKAIYLNALANTDVAVNALAFDNTSGGGKIIRFGANDVFYTSVDINTLSYEAYEISPTTLAGTDWRNYLTIGNRVSDTYLSYNAINGVFVAKAGANNHINTSAPFVYKFTLTDSDSTVIYDCWNSIFFPSGEGLIGGNEEIIEDIKFDDTIPEITTAPFTLAVHHESLYIYPHIVKVIINNEEVAVGNYCTVSAENMELATDGNYVGKSFTVTPIWSTICQEDYDVICTLEVDIYIKEGGIQPDDKFTKQYQFILPKVYSPQAFLATDALNNEGLWLYLNILKQLLPNNALGNIVIENGYLRASALSSATLNTLDLSVDTISGNNLSLDVNLSNSIAYCNEKGISNKTYANIVAANIVNTAYISGFDGIDYLTRLTSLTMDNLSLSASDLSALSDCVSINTLSMNNCDVSNVSLDQSGAPVHAAGKIYLAGLSKLITAKLNDNHIESIDGVFPSSLERLELQNNDTTLLGVSRPLVLSGIGALYKLSYLDVSNCGITDFTPLTDLSALSTIYLFGNVQTDSGNIINTEKKYWVYVHLYNHIRNISIYLTGASVSDIFSVSSSDSTVSGEIFLPLNTNEMYQNYYELYTAINAIMLMKEYASETQLISHIDSFLAMYGTGSQFHTDNGYYYTASYVRSATYVTLSLTAVLSSGSIAAEKLFYITVS